MINIKLLITLGLFVFSTNALFSQNVGIGTTTPTHPLDIDMSTPDDPVRVRNLKSIGDETSVMMLDPTNELVRYWPLDSLVRYIGPGQAGGDSDWDINANGSGLEAAPAGNNIAASLYSLSAGFNNNLEVNNNYSIIAGGRNNTIPDGSGFGNTVVSGGQGNFAAGAYTVIAGGRFNTTSAGVASNTIGGGASNSISGSGSNTIAGGFQNDINSSHSFIGGGLRNSVRGAGGIVVGGEDHIAAGFNSTVSGGEGMVAYSYGEWVGGLFNTVYTPQGGNNMYSFNDRIFTIGNGSSSTSLSNALTVFKNGNATLAGVLTQSSDRRLKRDVNLLKNVSLKLNEINGYSYFWKDNEHRGNEKQIGLIAQEVETVFPELVSESLDERHLKSVNYSGLVPVLVEAHKEQEAKIERLENELKEIKEVLKELMKEKE